MNNILDLGIENTLNKKILDNLSKIKALIDENIQFSKKVLKEDRQNFKSRKIINKYDTLLGILSQIKKIQ
jgi:hypothetical protein